MGVCRSEGLVAAGLVGVLGCRAVRKLPRLTSMLLKRRVLTTIESVGQRQSPLGPSTLISKFLVVAAAAIPAALYLLYVYHYGVNVPFADDWQVTRIVSLALHGHFTLSLLWSQWTSSREVTGRLVFISFGFIDHLNLRAVMLLSAGIFVATFALVLICVRSYWGRRLTFWPVLTLGVVWFSLVDFRNSLWSNQLSWYLCLFFVVAVVYLLLISRKNAPLSLGLGVVAAVLASLSFSFGFLAWPLGLICLLWLKRGRLELTIWIIAAVVMAVIYFHGWQTNDGGCLATSARCSFSYGLSRPDRLIEYYVLLVGNVVPLSSTGIETHLWVHIVQGIGLLLAAILVGVQTFRERQVRPNPLPLLLIVFGLLFDLTIAPARFGVGLQSSVSLEYSRYTMPNVLLIVAIVIYGWAHVPKWHNSSRIRFVGFGTLAALLLVQSVFGNVQGISNGRNWYMFNVSLGRIIVNLDQVPIRERPCYQYVGESGFANLYYQIAMRDHLGIFEPGTDHLYRAKGLQVLPGCIR